MDIIFPLTLFNKTPTPNLTQPWHGKDSVPILWHPFSQWDQHSGETQTRDRDLFFFFSTPIVDFKPIKSMWGFTTEPGGLFVCAFENIVAFLVPHPENDNPCLCWAPILN